jgi:hypothetical protein
MTRLNGGFFFVALIALERLIKQAPAQTFALVAKQNCYARFGIRLYPSNAVP